MVQRSGSCWFLLSTGEYAGPYTKDDVPLAMSKYLARAPVRLIEATKSGWRYRQVNEVLRESGSLADKVVSDLTRQCTFFDPEQRVIYEACTPLRVHQLAPKFDEEYDRWMQIAAGPHYQKLVDWMSCCYDLTKLLCAIYFDGPKGSGKSMFAYGLAKMWTDGPPAEIRSVLSDFNAELVRCPLILADEEIPRRYKDEQVTTTIRSMVSVSQRTLKRKYQPTSELHGAIRLILAANNEFLLDTRDVSSTNDLEAIAQRFLYLNVPAEATNFMESLPYATKQRWLKGGIAQHALWLMQNSEMALERRGKRFWVEGDISQMHRMLMTGSQWNSWCCEWLVRYLMNPGPYDSKGTGLIRKGEGELLVNEQALIDFWDLYLKVKVDPITSKVGAAMRAISKSTRRRQLRNNGIPTRYRMVDVDMLLAWADRFNIGDRETMLVSTGAMEREPGDDKDDTNVINLHTKTRDDVPDTSEVPF